MNVIPKDNNDYTKYEQAVYDMWNDLENSEKRPVKRPASACKLIR